MARHLKRRVPKLRFTKLRGIGWHVSYREQATQIPKRHRFGISERKREPEARVLYHAWMLEHLGASTNGFPTVKPPPPKRAAKTEILSGSILEIASSVLETERHRARTGDEIRRRGTIAAPVFRDRKKQLYDFQEFLNTRHGSGAVARMRLADLSMDDIEEYNRFIVGKKYSDSQVGKRMQLVKAIIDRGGRAEHGGQVLTWNWDSRDIAHGLPAGERSLPSVKQLKKLLKEADLRGKTMIWLGIGMGLGARDLSVIQVGQIDNSAYDLRRMKTGVERFGTTPPLVWAHVSKYQAEEKRPRGQLLFVTRIPMDTPSD